MMVSSEPFGEATHRVTRTDAELLQAARQDPQAFRELYERYATWMRSWFLRHTGSESAALDLTAETFAQAFGAARRFRDEAGGSAAPSLVGLRRNLLRPHPPRPVPQASPHRDGRSRASRRPDRLRRVRGLRAGRRARRSGQAGPA